MDFFENKNNVDEQQPLIYMWEIINDSGIVVGRYVGKAKDGATRPRTHYLRNVRNILAGKRYRSGNADGYRRIHKALAEAATQKYSITLHFLCNIFTGENINEIEQRCISEKNTRGSEAWQLNG